MVLRLAKLFYYSSSKAKLSQASFDYLLLGFFGKKMGAGKEG